MTLRLKATVVPTHGYTVPESIRNIFTAEQLSPNDEETLGKLRVYLADHSELTPEGFFGIVERQDKQGDGARMASCKMVSVTFS